MEFRDKVSKGTDNKLQSSSTAELASMQVQLPMDHPRPAVQNFRGAAYEFTSPSRSLKTVAPVCRARAMHASPM